MATEKNNNDKESKKTVKTSTSAKKTSAKASAKPAAKTTAKKTTAKATTKKSTTKASAKKEVSSKKAPAKATAKKSTTKSPAKKETTTKKSTTVSTKTAGFKIEQKQNEGSLLDILGATPVAATKEKPKSSKGGKKETTTKKVDAKVKKTTGPQRVLHKARTFNKEEKVLYKRLEEAFNYVANLTMVIEERTLDSNAISDLTLSEIHVLEVVNKEATVPMTKVANQLKITVGSLTTCVNRLVKKEYLFRERDDVDHRIIKVSTTQKAKKALKVHDQFHEQILLGVLDGVTIRDATKVMAQFARTLENYINPKEKNYENPIDTKKKKNI